jgi:MFS family permease
MNRPERPLRKNDETGSHAAGGVLPTPPPEALTRAAARRLSPQEIRTVFFGLMLTTFIAAVNQTIIAPPLASIGRAFNDFENLSFVVTAFLLTSTAVAPLYGKMSDIYGRRTMMLAAIGLFVAGSIVAALAPNMATLIAGRALQGIGGGGILPLAQSTIADIITPRERGRYQAYMGTSWILAGIAGPALGGLIADYLSWTWIFWVNVPLGIIAMLMINHALKLLPQHGRRHSLDLLGAGLMMAAAVPLMLALTWGGTRYPWTSPTIAALIALSLAFTLAFWLRLTRAREPFLPLSVLGNPVMRMGTLATSCALGVSIGLTIYMPLYFEVMHGLSPRDTGFALIAIVVMTTPGSMLSGQAMLRMRRYKWVAIVGLSLAIAVLTALALYPRMPVIGVIAVLAMVGLGIGATYPVTTVSIQNAVSHDKVGIAMGAMNFFRSLASAFVVALMGAIVLAGFGFAPERGVATHALTAASAPGGADLAHVFSYVFFVGAAILAVALAALIAMEERVLRGPRDESELATAAAPAPTQGRG